MNEKRQLSHPFEVPGDFERSYKVIKELLKDYRLSYDEEMTLELTETVMAFSDSKGGDYSEKMILAFGKAYIENVILGRYRREN